MPGLGSDWNASEIAALRAANGGTIVLTSINACETSREDLPDDYYLTNVSRPAATKGRLQSWPGAWRLDLSNPAVQDYQAKLMYDLVTVGGEESKAKNVTLGEAVPLTYDGLFVDNVFMDDGAGSNREDIFHNPFFPATITPGKADDPAVFAERWRSGMVRELALFRERMPHALMDGHISVQAMRDDANISGQFNAVSIGFTVPRMVEGLESFAVGRAQYHDWMSIPPREPHITMVESAVRLQLGYGYGFGHNLTLGISHGCENSNSVPGAAPPAIGRACSQGRGGLKLAGECTAALRSICGAAQATGAGHCLGCLKANRAKLLKAHCTPDTNDWCTTTPRGYLQPETYLFARSEYQYMRFGLGFTLMEDGYYTHELGDSWHGMDWDYDELHFNLGLPTGNATAANTTAKPGAVLPPIELDKAWSLWLDPKFNGNGSWSMDATVKPDAAAPPSVRVNVQRTAGGSGEQGAQAIDLHLDDLEFRQGDYSLSFWARSSRAASPLLLNARKGADPWMNFGLGKSACGPPATTLFSRAPLTDCLRLQTRRLQLGPPGRSFACP